MSSSFSLNSALPARRRSLPGLDHLAAVLEAPRAFWFSFRTWHLNRETRRVLAALEDHQRRDIGLDPRPTPAQTELSPALQAWLR